MLLKTSVARPSEICLGINSALEDIVMRGLQGDPSQRFSTAKEMAIALEEETSMVSATALGDRVKKRFSGGMGR